MKEKFPEYTEPNVWPSEAVLPGFKEAFQKLSGLILQVATYLAKVRDLSESGRLNNRPVMNMVTFSR